MLSTISVWAAKISGSIVATAETSVVTGTFEEESFEMSEQALMDSAKARILCSQLDELILESKSRRNSIASRPEIVEGAATVLLRDEAANELGDPDAQYSLGCRYHARGEYTTALRFYRLAALKLHTASINNIAVLVAQGKGTFPDEEFALNWFKLGMDLGNHKSQLNYATLRTLPLNSEHMDRAEGYKILNNLRKQIEATGDEFWMQSARNRIILRTVYNNLACMHCRGMGTDINTGKAMRMFELASQMDSAVAKYNLGAMFLNALGVERDENLAQIYLHDATLDADHVDMPVIRSATDPTKLLMVTTLLLN
jgi:tetratricopeptide (TPR) repeat protein